MSQVQKYPQTWTQANPENEVRYAYGVTQWSGYVHHEYKAFGLSEEDRTALYRQDEAPVCFLKARGNDYMARWLSPEPTGEHTEAQSDEAEDKKDDDEPPKHGYHFG